MGVAGGLQGQDRASKSNFLSKVLAGSRLPILAVISRGVGLLSTYSIQQGVKRGKVISSILLFNGIHLSFDIN